MATSTALFVPPHHVIPASIIERIRGPLDLRTLHTPPMAEAILRLRAIYLSGDFDEYWDFHVQQDQLRLYALTPWTVVPK